MTFVFTFFIIIRWRAIIECALVPDEKKRVEENCHTKEKSSRKRERSEEKGEILAV